MLNGIANVLGIVLLVFIFVYAGLNVMTSHNLGCDNFTKARPQQICAALEHEQEWTWFGHATISPKWRVTFNSVQKVYCQLHLSPQDANFLYEIGGAPNRKLESGAGWLLTLLHNEWRKDESPIDVECNGKAAWMRSPGEWCHANRMADENSIFNPRNPNYILKAGCPK